MIDAVQARVGRRVRRQCVALVLSLLASLLVWLSAAVASAQCPSDTDNCPATYESARGLALGTGLRATAISTSALAYTPAALALGNLYHLEGTIDYMPEIKTVALGANVVDSSTSRLGAGIGLRGFVSGDGGHDGLDGRLGLAFPFSEVFSVGLLGRYISLSTEEQDGDETNELELAEGVSMDASLRIAPAESVHIDLAALNLIDLETPYAPVTLAASIGLALGRSFSVGGDVLTDMTTYDDPALTLGAGAEYLGGEAVPIRGGYLVDLERKLHAFSLGIGYADQRVGLDLSLRQQIKGGNATRVIGALKYHVN